jgi:glycosyltransferase involved in cell wall biosynthesis
MRVVIGHDFLETYGGAERILQEIAQIFPDAPVVSILGRRSVAERMGIEDRFHSLLPARPSLLRHYRLLTPLLPALIDRFRLPEADVLLTSSYAFAHRFRTKNLAPQVCCCHGALRFAWTMTHSYRGEWSRGPVPGKTFDLFAAGMRRSDRRASERVQQYLTLSQYAAWQVDTFYGRPAEIIGPPVDTELFRPSTNGLDEHFLFSGRLLEAYKRPSIVIDAFRRLPFKLIVAGDGPARARLEAGAPSNVEFVGHLGDDELVRYMQRCQALIFPSRDDFGLGPVEAMACGRPVLAYGAGGALETVVDGRTGAFFDDQTADAVEHAVRAFRAEDYDRAAIRAHAEQWSRASFKARLVAAVERAAAAPSMNGHASPLAAAAEPPPALDYA